jgi:trimethylguanosine synthase
MNDTGFPGGGVKATRCACGVVVDAFAGVGGSTVQLARTCGSVRAVEACVARLTLARHNAAVYQVRSTELHLHHR